MKKVITMRNQVENRAGLTPAGETELMPRIVTGQTAPRETQLTPPTRTRRRYKQRARKCRCGCGELVEPTPQAPHKVYFSDACRNRDYRRRRAKARAGTAQPTIGDALLELATCDYCGNTFLRTSGHSAKYCKPAHRVAAAEARRSAAVDALIVELRMSEDEVIDMVDRMGMKLVTRYLRQRQYEYNDQARRWEITLHRVK